MIRALTLLALVSIGFPTQAQEVRYLPVVGSVPGNFGSFFKTAVQIHNPTTAVMSGRFVFHPQGTVGRTGDPSFTYQLAPGTTRFYPDLLPVMFQAGIGSVDLISTGGGFPVSVVRIFNDAGEAGTTGMTEELLRADQALFPGASGVLVAPPDPVAARFNIGIRTLGAGALITKTLRQADGVVKQTLQQTYASNFFEQTTARDFLGMDIAGNDTITVRIEGGSAFIYGAITDNKTQDPSLQIARLATGEEGDTRILTVVGSSQGALGSFFKTMVQFHNPGQLLMGGRYTFHPAGSSASSSDIARNYVVLPGQTISFDDLLPSMSTSGLGSLTLVASTGPPPLTVARVFNDAGESGTTGMTQELVAPDGAIQTGQSAVLIAPPDLNAARYNLGVRTLTSGASMTVTVKDTGGQVISTVSRTFSASYFQQIPANAFIGGTLIANASISMSVTAGSAIVYGATTDNLTQDPSVQFAHPNP